MIKFSFFFLRVRWSDSLMKQTLSNLEDTSINSKSISLKEKRSFTHEPNSLHNKLISSLNMLSSAFFEFASLIGFN